MLDRRTAMGHNNHSSLTTKEIDEELEEGVDRKCLSRTYVRQHREMHHASPIAYGGHTS